MKTWFELSLPPIPPSCPGREGVNSTQPQEKFKNLDSGSTIWATILSVMLLGMGNFENQLNFIISRFCLCRAPLFGPHFLCHAARDGRHWKQTEFYYFQVLSLPGSTIFFVMLLGMGDIENKLNFIIFRFCHCWGPSFGPPFSLSYC